VLEQLVAFCLRDDGVHVRGAERDGRKSRVFTPRLARELGLDQREVRRRDFHFEQREAGAWRPRRVAAVGGDRHAIFVERERRELRQAGRKVEQIEVLVIAEDREAVNQVEGRLGSQQRGLRQFSGTISSRSDALTGSRASTRPSVWIMLSW